MTRATQPLPEFTVTLSDGVSTIGLMTSSKSGVRRLPRSPGAERKAIRQEDWTGGRGSDLYRRDTTKYLDSINLHTTVDGHAMNGPQCRTTHGRGTAGALSRKAVMYQPGVEAHRATPCPTSLATALKRSISIVGGQGFTTATVSILLRKVGTPTGSVTLALYTDSGGSVGTLISALTITAASIGDDLTKWRPISAAWDLTVAGTYWVVCYWPGNLTGDADGGNWLITAGTGTDELYVRLDARVDECRRVKFFVYKRALYALVMYAAANSQILMNGDRGVATGTQSTSTLRDSTKAGVWLASEWDACTVLIIAGTNKGDYRTVISTDGATGTLTVSPAWPQACVTGEPGDGGSEYVILGSDLWKEGGYSTALSGSGLTMATDVAVLGETVYFAQGDTLTLRRMREYNNEGVWTRDFAADGDNSATFLLTAPHWSTHDPAIYRGLQSTVAVSVAPQVGWGTPLEFAVPMEITSRYSLLTGITEYNNTVYAATDDNVWELKDGSFARVPITIDRARDERNGVAMVWWNTQLFHSFQGGLERLYGSVVDDIGPDRGTGMEADRRGQIVDLVPVANKLFALYYSPGGYSTVMETVDPGGNWHNLYTHTIKAARASGLYYQTIPGQANRLWFGVGTGLNYLVLPDDLHTPLHDANARYAHEGFLVTGWFDAGSPELDHFFDELRLTANYLTYKGAALDTDRTTDGNQLEFQYQLDNALTTETWYDFASPITAYPFTRIEVGDQTVTGRMIRFRVRFTCNGRLPAVLNALELRLVQMNEVMFDFIFDIQLGDRLMLMTGNDRTEKAEAVMAVIESWDEDATPLTMRVAMPNTTGLIDNLRGHIDPVALVSGAWNDRETRLSGNITFKSL